MSDEGGEPSKKKPKKGSSRILEHKLHDVLGGPLSKFSQNRPPFKDEVLRRYLWFLSRKRNNFSG